eukprot:3986094-Amphidinium_carterae.1
MVIRERAFLLAHVPEKGQRSRQERELSPGARAGEKHTDSARTKSSGARTGDTAKQYLRIPCGAWICLSRLVYN